MKHSNQVRMEFNIHKGKNKAGVFPTSLCKECGATKAPAFYKGWIVDGFSRADDECLGIYCKDCKNKKLAKL